MNKAKQDTLLGLVFFGALGVLLWATLNLTDLSFDKPEPIRVFMPDTTGLNVGDTVTILGRKIGVVEAIDGPLDRQTNRMAVDLSLTEKLNLREGYKFEIKQVSVLGGSGVAISPGRGQPVGIADADLLGSNAGGALDSLSKTFDGETVVGEELAAALKSVETFFQSLVDPDNSVGYLLSNREFSNELMAILKSARNSMEAIERGEGALGRIVHDKTVGDDVAALAANLREISDKGNTGNGLVARLFNDTILAEDFAGILSDTRSLISETAAGRGLLGALFHDAEVAQNFRDAMGDVADVIRKANDPTSGFLGAILGDPAMSDRFNAILENVDDFTAKLTGGDGLVAMLVNDSDLAEKVSRLFNQVARAIEDAREAAPIGTLFQVVGGVF